MFLELIASESSEFAILHLHPLIEVAVRIQLTTTGPDEDALKALKETSGELLELLEKKVGASNFIGMYGEVQKGLQTRRAEKKRKYAADAIVNPKAHAMRKVMHKLLIVPYMQS